MAKPKILYILGSGRSGSTILDMLLGNHENIESFGEIANLAAAGWMNNEYCSSGDKVNESPFWNSIKSDFLKRANDEDAIVKLSAINKQVNKKKNILNHFFFGKIPAGIKEEFLFFNECLFEALFNETGKDIIVDSSKMPLRGELLACSKKFDVYFIHLIRDGRKVLESLQVELKASLEKGVQTTIKKRNLFKVAFFWHVMNICAEKVCAKHKQKSIAIKYEDFLKDPSYELKRIGNLLNLNVQSIIEIAVMKKVIKPFYTVAGNRIRMQREIRLKEYKPDNKTVKSGNAKLFEILNNKLLKRYNYL
jgi:hypothetical protein